MSVNKDERMLTLSKITAFAFLFIALVQPGNTQNLVPNHSFESYTTCPPTFGGSGPTVASPWISPTFASPDIYNSCASGVVGVPFNWAGIQWANSGFGFAGLYVEFSNEYREYIQAPLLEPLVANTLYSVSFYVNLADIACAAEWIGAYLSVDPPQDLSSSMVLNYVPQVESNMGFITDITDWVLVSGCFTASGGEQYITIGNFRTNAQTPILPPCPTPLSYYFVDDVIVVQTTPQQTLPIELGGPVVACLEYVIDPGYFGYQYTWEDGSHGSTLVVNETGVYSLTISDDCHFGVDSIEVFIHGIDHVDLGPNEVVICNGDEYVISLDPDHNNYEWNDGSTEPEYTITTPGIYSVTLDDGCEISMDEITVAVIDGIPSFDLGEETYLCFDEEIIISLDPALGAFHWHDNSTDSEYTISQPGTYVLTITNVCGTSSDAITVTSLDIPYLNIGPDSQMICTGQSVTINIDPGPGEILWQDGSDEATYVITSPGTYDVTLTNICGSAFDQIHIIQADTPSIHLGADTILCNSQELLLTTQQLFGNFQWQDGSVNDSFLVTIPGIYYLTVENFCGISSDTISVNFQMDVSVPDLGPDTSLCPGEAIVLYASNPTANYLWQDLSTADSLLVTTSGIYSLQVSTFCGTSSDTIQVTVNANPPQVDLPLQLSLCQGEAITLDAFVTGVNYLWNDNSQNQQLIVTSPGIYSITVSNACGTDIDTTLVYNGGNVPTVALGNDLDLCPGETMLLMPVFSDVNTWLWQDGSSAQTYVASNAGVITVEVSNSCSTAYDTLIVNVLPATPPLTLGADTALCPGESFVLTINTPGVNILWPDNSTDPDYLVSGAGVVFATISNSCGQSFDTLLVNEIPDIPLFTLGPDQFLCPGEVITINPSIADVSYTWQDGSNTPTYQSTQQETIILTIANDCGIVTDTLEVIESTEGPQVDLGNDIQVCEGDIVTIPSGITGVNYLWQDGSVNSQYVTSQSGMIILQVNNNCGTDSDTILVDISGVPPTPHLGQDTTLCEGMFLNLVSNANSETMIEWQDGSSLPTFIVSTPGTYILSESNRCGSESDTITVLYLEAPDPFSLGPDTTLCAGESIMLTAPSTLFEIRWQDESTQPVFVVDQANTYSLQLSNDCGIVSDAIQIDFDSRTPHLHLDPTIEWCAGDIITLDASQPFEVDYLWSTGSRSPSIQISSPGQYSITASTLCSFASQNVEVVPGTDCVDPDIHKGIIAPNVFSPNGDGINDVFSISIASVLNVTSMQGTIYDRWGNVVFSTEVIPFVWDGYFAGESVLPGVYVFTIKIKYMDQAIEKEYMLAGDVTLLR